MSHTPVLLRSFVRDGESPYAVALRLLAQGKTLRVNLSDEDRESFELPDGVLTAKQLLDLLGKKSTVSDGDILVESPNQEGW